MIRTTGNRDIVVAALKHAAPYIRMFKRKVFVLKAGGELFSDGDATRALIEQIAILHQVGVRVVLVHGGGPQSTEMAEALGLTTQIIQGRRVTDESAIEVAAMVLNGQINPQILAACQELDVPAVGISGADDGLIHATKRPPVRIDGSESDPVDFGFVGDIESVDSDVLQTHLANGLVPVISPLSADSDGTLLNINADTVAAALAAALNAEKLILVTGAPGILENSSDPGSLVSYLDLTGLKRLRDGGALESGMLPKAAAIEAAIEGGVPRVHVISYRVPDSLLLEIFTNEGTGTLVVESIGELTAAEQAPAR
ncbi:MAG: acetylglutamate kinase [Gammaproteobacteria bacterium]